MATTQEQLDQDKAEFDAEFANDALEEANNREQDDQEDAEDDAEDGRVAAKDSMGGGESIEGSDDAADSDEVAQPAVNAVIASARMAGDEQSKAFTEAFKSEAPMLPEPKAPTFKEAFASARKGGEKVFEWQGKKYTTEMAKPKAAPVVAAKMDGPAHETAAVVAKPAQGDLKGASSLAEAMAGAKHTGMGSK
jgi:hypothetical protein